MTETTSSSPADAERHRQTFTSWLVDEGYSVSSLDAEDALWLVRAEDPAKRVLVVGQKPQRPDMLIFQATVNVSEQHTKKVAALQEPRRREFLTDMALTLLTIGVDFSGVGHPFQRVQLTEHLHLDGLDRNRFIDTIRKLRHGILAVQLSIAKKLAEPPPEATGEGMAVH